MFGALRRPAILGRSLRLPLCPRASAPRRSAGSYKLPPQSGDFDESPDAVKLRRSPMRQDPDDFSDGEELLEDSFVIEPTRHTATLIWLHGIRDGQRETKPMFEATKINGVRYVIPRAPKIPITALDSEERRAWFDIADQQICDEDDEEDAEGLAESHEKLERLLEFETGLLQGESERVFIGGFAIGGAMAIHAGLGHGDPLGGIISFAGYAALPEVYPMHVTEENRETPVLAVHGTADKAVHVEFARARYEVLRDAGVDVELRERFGEGHTMTPEQLLNVQLWMKDQLRKKGVNL